MRSYYCVLGCGHGAVARLPEPVTHFSAHGEVAPVLHQVLCNICHTYSEVLGRERFHLRGLMRAKEFKGTPNPALHARLRAPLTPPLPAQHRGFVRFLPKVSKLSPAGVYALGPAGRVSGSQGYYGVGNPSAA